MIWPNKTKRLIVWLLLISILEIFAVGIVLGILAIGFDMEFMLDEDVVIFQLQTVWLLTVIWMMMAKRLWVFKRLPGWREWWLNIRYWLVALAIYLAFETGYTSLFKIEAGENQAIIEATMKDHYWLTMILVVLIAPIFEEFWFRRVLGGVFFQMKRKIWHVIGFMLAAFSFGAVHLVSIDEWPLFIIYGGSGLLFTYAYYKTKRLYVPITLHFVNNFIAAVMMTITI